MDKQEFIDKLKVALNNDLAPSMVAEHVKYYEGYIHSELQKGRSEEAVMASLGDPRLIARTIIQTNTTEDGSQKKGGYQNASYQEGSYQSGACGAGSYQQTARRDQGTISRRYSMPGWLWGLVVVLILVVLIGLVMSVLSFLAPILIPIVVVGFLVKLFRDWLN